MPDSFTGTINLVKPEPGGSADTWGQKINNNMDKVDDEFSNLGDLSSLDNLNDAEVSSESDFRQKIGVGDAGTHDEDYYATSESVDSRFGRWYSSESSSDDFSYVHPDGSARRALVAKSDSDTLTLNYSSDFDDGVAVEGQLTARGGLNVLNSGTARIQPRLDVESGHINLGTTGQRNKSIHFAKETNDRGLIEHREQDNTATFTFSVSDDDDGNDRFRFGSRRDYNAIQMWTNGNLKTKGYVRDGYGNDLGDMAGKIDSLRSPGREDIGAYGLFTLSGGGSPHPGSTISGSNLSWAPAGGYHQWGTPSGTWRLMGNVKNADGTQEDSTTLCVRIS